MATGKLDMDVQITGANVDCSALAQHIAKNGSLTFGEIVDFCRQNVSVIPGCKDVLERDAEHGVDGRPLPIDVSRFKDFVRALIDELAHKNIVAYEDDGRISIVSAAKDYL